MREIKFRALVQYPGLEKIWVYYQPFTTPHAIYDQNNEDKSKVATIYVKNLQFTGLKDKNGVEIYEGDIVEIFTHSYTKKKIYTYSRVKKVEWLNARVESNIGYNISSVSEMEVIGNVYQNPELLTHPTT